LQPIGLAAAIRPDPSLSQILFPTSDHHMRAHLLGYSTTHAIAFCLIITAMCLGIYSFTVASAVSLGSTEQIINVSNEDIIEIDIQVGNSHHIFKRNEDIASLQQSLSKPIRNGDYDRGPLWCIVHLKTKHDSYFFNAGLNDEYLFPVFNTDWEGGPIYEVKYRLPDVKGIGFRMIYEHDNVSNHDVHINH
jgi:hypothetical protein